jgi:hypothetical protein
MDKVSVILLISALALSTVSAYYSIVGLAAIFAASFWAVLILATTLEVGKLVLVSWLYRNWHFTPWPIRTYLTGGVIILMMITSLGIFGFLSQAHNRDQALSEQSQLQVAQVTAQIEIKQTQLAEARTTLDQLNRSIDVQLNANRSQQALASRRAQQTERAQLQTRMQQLQNEIIQLTQQRTQMQQTQVVDNTKLGPVRYVIELFDPDADPAQAVKWIILVLVLVCDPLAVLMLMAANQGQTKSTDPVSANPHTTQIRWDPENKQLWVQQSDLSWHPVIHHVPKPAHESTADQVIPMVQVVEQAVMELLKQRPIFEVASRPFTNQSGTQVTPEPLNVSHLTKVIEETLENWMKHTLTVTYPADQVEIDKIVDRVILKRAQQTPESEPELSTHIPQPETLEPTLLDPQVSSTHDVDPAQPQTDTASSRRVSEYFGDSRIRGREHKISTHK